MAEKLIQILYVDDNYLDRELVRDALEKEHGGFKLFEAASGEEFKKMFAEREYDLILSDFHILGFEGLQVIDIVKSKDPRLPVILVTGTGSEEVAVEAMKRGAADYVLKSPSHIQRLPQSIHAVLEKTRLEDRQLLALKELEESETRYRILAETSPDMIFVIDRKDRVQYANNRAARQFGKTPEEVIGKARTDLFPPGIAESQTQGIQHVLSSTEPFSAVSHTAFPEGDVWLDTTLVPILNDVGVVDSVMGVSRDITEYKQAEQLLLASESKYRSLFDNVPDGIFRTSTDGKILAANPALIKMFGFDSLDEILKKKVSDLYMNPSDRDMSLQQINDFGEVHNLEVSYKRKDGNRMIAIENARAIKDEKGRVIYYEGTLTDITERKLAEQENINLAKFPSENPNPVLRLSREGIILFTNNPGESILHMWGCELGESAPRDWCELVAETFESREYKMVDLECLEKIFSMFVVPVPGSEYVNIYGGDITKRKKAEEALRESENRFRTTLENMELIAIQLDGNGRITYANPYFVKLSGYSRKELIGKDWSSTFIPSPIQSELKQYLHDAIFKGDIEHQHENLIRMKDGTERLIRWNNSIINNPGGAPIGMTSIGEDITDEKEAEKAIMRQLNELTVLQHVARASSQASNSDELIEGITQIISSSLYPDNCGVLIFDKESQSLTPHYSYLGVTADDFKDTNNILIPVGKGVAGRVAATRNPLYIPDIQNDSNYININNETRSELCVPIMINEQLLGVINTESTDQNAYDEKDERLLLTIAGNLATSLEKLRLYEETSRRLEFVQVLRRIDMAISSSVDLGLTLGNFVELVMSHMSVDAVDILLFNPKSRMLVYRTGLGFRTNVLKYSLLSLGEGLAGKAALEREIIHIPDLAVEKGIMANEIRLANENFVSYLSVPLIAKGQVKGVMEIFNRSPLTLGQEWMEQVEILARQAAIAIDNGSMFDDLQNSNQELVMAYDATIEGWSKAMNLRDNETEEHTQRVTLLTLKMATKLGMSDSEMAHIRRGALLHDIGKIGVPDGILLKTGPLNDEEWDIMRQHPRYAFEMIAPISYLKPALDIPYCHHEKWDGSGYPRGLKGELIPLSARIFAVVDVYDALTSDRPYRNAWQEKKALEYIREQSGKQFDPKVVEEFLKILPNI